MDRGNMKHLYAVIVVMFYLWIENTAMRAQSFKCNDDCTQVICTSNKTFRKFCKHGVVNDPCGCCQICARGPGEYCDLNGSEGPALIGTCGKGLYCKPVPDPIMKFGFCAQDSKVNSRKRLTRTSRGAVISWLTNNPNHVDSMRTDQCQPKCTPQFCTNNPGGVCSAVDNAIIDRDCQKPCQHTVCEACYYKTRREPPCPKCAFDDFKCFQKFAKCVRKETCTRQKFPCQTHLQKRKFDGRFVCKVAGCIHP